MAEVIGLFDKKEIRLWPGSAPVGIALGAIIDAGT